MRTFIGIDIVTITRFNAFTSYSPKQLSRIFSPEEITYAHQRPAKSSERFAARFAAKEAFLKAAQQAFPGHSLSLPTVLKSVSVTKGARHAPLLIVDWHALGINHHEYNDVCVILSLSHSDCCAYATVLIEKKSFT